MSEISDDELESLRLDEKERIQTTAYASVDTVRGAGAVKSIFGPQNKKRVIACVVAGLFAGSAIIYSLFFMDRNALPNRGGVQADIALGTSVVGQTSVNQVSTSLERDAAKQYNEDVLPLQQQSNPAAHPLIITEPTVLKDDENPFVPQAQAKKAGKVTQLGQVDGQQASGGQHQGSATVDVTQMDKILNDLLERETQRPEPLTVQWDYAEEAGTEDGLGSLAANSQPGDDASTTGAGTSQCKRVERAGQMAFATADFALNSDVGGPVSLTIRNGKMRGNQLIGSFERKDVWLRMELDKLVTPESTIPIAAIGLDMDTTLNAVEGDLDRHLIYRYGWWGVGTVLKALGKGAESNVDEDIIVSNGTVLTSSVKDSARELKMALGSLGADLGDAMQDRLNRPITVSLKVGDEVGVYFLDDVCAQAGAN